MHTRHQYNTIGFGRSKAKRMKVIIALNAKAGLRRSSQCVRGVESAKRNETGNSEGKPMLDRPCAVKGRKFVKFATSSRRAQPPLESLISPLHVHFSIRLLYNDMQTTHACSAAAQIKLSPLYVWFASPPPTMSGTNAILSFPMNLGFASSTPLH